MLAGPVYILVSLIFAHLRVSSAPVLLSSPILGLLGEVLVLLICDLMRDPF